MKRMLINATQPEELRVALVDGQKLHDLDIENRRREQMQGNIYKAKVIHIEPSLEAAFVDFGPERRGFLPLKDINPQNFSRPHEGGRKNIKDLLNQGQEVIVQVEKEERGNKGAAVTGFVSLAGRYMVLMPTDPRAAGISRRISTNDRSEMREVLAQLDIPSGMGVIIRTAGVGRSAEELQWDLDYLLKLWDAIQAAGEAESAPRLLYAENNLVLRAIRDYMGKDIGELLIDNQDAFDEAQAFIAQVMPSYSPRVKLYDDPIPLFSRYQIESQIATAFKRTLKLPSGGALVIDPTEALVSIDINSARATKGADIEETAMNTNMEAAEEIARQLRLRDVGGLIVIDFIDMSSTENQRTLENSMRAALKQDRARVQIGRISQFGLMQMSRQRLRPSLEELTTEVCPRCNGQGRIQDIKSLALAILRLVEEECLKERRSRVRALVPLNVASYLLNEKRTEVTDIEQRTSTHIVIVPNVNMETPQYEVQGLRDGSDDASEGVPSYELTEYALSEAETTAVGNGAQRPADEPAVRAMRPSAPKPPSAPAKPGKPGLITRLKATLFSDGAAPGAQEEKKPAQPRRQRQANSQESAGKAKRQRSDRGDKSNKPAKSANRDARRTTDASRKAGEGARKGGDNTAAKAKRKDAPRKDAPRKEASRGAQRAAKGGRAKKAEETGQQPQAAIEESPKAMAANASEDAHRSPNEEALAHSKRRPRRNRGEVAEQVRQQGSRAAHHPAQADTKPAAQAEAAPSTAPSLAAKAPEETAPVQAETAPSEVQKPSPGRAFNDPREVRQRRQAALVED